MFNVKDTVDFLLKGVSDINDVASIKEKVVEVAKQNRPLNIKFGLDPSAPDIHLGHAVALRKLRQLQKLGHTITIIIGDFTGMIGDPSGKSKVRNQLSQSEVKENAKTYVDQMFKVLGKNTIVLHNSDWLSKMTFPEIINLSSGVTVARMLEREDFAKRYKAKQPISVHEFFYPLMQAYDSVVCKADIEFGGTDQTFNVLMGRNVQRDYGVTPQVPLFVPLLEGIDGKEKMSKSLGNYIGISESANTMYEKVMKIPDNLIVKYFELCTDVHPDKIKHIKEMLAGRKVNPRDIKMALAREITSTYHSQDLTSNAEAHFVSIYQQKTAPQDVAVLNYKNEDIIGGNRLNIVNLLASSKIFKSNSEIRRLLQSGSIRLNGQKIDSMEVPILEEMVLQVGKGKMFKVSLDKKKHFQRHTEQQLSCPGGGVRKS